MFCSVLSTPASFAKCSHWTPTVLFLVETVVSISENQGPVLMGTFDLKTWQELKKALI